MSLHTQFLILANPLNDEIQAVNVHARGDPRCFYLIIPRSICNDLGLIEVSERVIGGADGKLHVAQYVGPVEIRLSGYCSFGGALVMGDTVLIGSMAIDDFRVLAP